MTDKVRGGSPLAGFFDPNRGKVPSKIGSGTAVVASSNEQTFIVDRLFALYVSQKSKGVDTKNSKRDLEKFIEKVTDPVKKADYYAKLVLLLYPSKK